MKLSEPKVVTFWISVALVLLGLLASQGTIPALAAYAFWLVVAGFVLLASETCSKTCNAAVGSGLAAENSRAASIRKPLP